LYICTEQKTTLNKNIATMSVLENIPTIQYSKYTLRKMYENTQEYGFNWSRTLRKHKALLIELEATEGYFKNNWSFSEKEVRIIFKHLRTPLLTKQNRELLDSMIMQMAEND